MNGVASRLLRVVFAAICLLCGLISAPAAGEEAKPVPALKVLATLSETKIAPEKWFQATFRVENVSAESQTIKVMACSYEDEWQTDNTKLTIGGHECAKNPSISMTLEPGKDYSKFLDIQVAADAPHGKLTFRLGFTSIGSKVTYWSDPLVLEVVAEHGERETPAVPTSQKPPLPTPAVSAPSNGAAQPPLDADAVLRKVELNVMLKNYEKVLAAEFEATLELSLGPTDGSPKTAEWVTAQSMRHDILAKFAIQLRDQIRERIDADNKAAKPKADAKDKGAWHCR